MLEAPWAAAEDIAKERRVGRSRMSDRRSILRESRRAFFRRSRTAFSVVRLYLVEKDTARESSCGIAFWSCRASDARVGRAVRRLER